MNLFEFIKSDYENQAFICGSIYSRRYDFVPLPFTVPLPLQRYPDSPSATVTDRYGPFTTFTQRNRPLLTVTESYR